MQRLVFTTLSAIALAGCAGNPVPEPRVPLVDTYRPTTQPAQIAEVRAAIQKYRDFSVAKREGWKSFGDDEPLMGKHFYNDEAPDYIAGDPLDFSRPNNLMYTEIDGEQVLTGVAFVVRLGEGEPMPQGFAGHDDRWHAHDFVAAIEAATEERPILGWLANRWLDDNYRKKGDNRGRLAMVHAWVTMENPDGIFADYNRTIPYKKLGLPDGYWHGASVETARGLNLATEGGCDAQNGTLWIANISRSQDRTIKAACRDGAEAVRSAIAQGGKERINAAGEAAWRLFDDVWQRTLTAEQKRRVAQMSEHGTDGHGDGHDGHGDHGDHDGHH